MLKRLPIFLFVFFLTGCATVTGPGVSEQEIRQATEELQVKSLAYKFKQIQKINAIGYHIVKAVPKEDIKMKPRSFIGLFAITNNKIADRLYHLDSKKGAVVMFVLEGTPVADAGLKEGDLVLEVDKKPARSLSSDFEYHLKAGAKAILTIERLGEKMEIPVTVGEIALGVAFTLVDDQSVNAATGPREIYVTYGLMNFAKSDDEIAAVLAHELGHFSRGHVNRMQGGNILGAIAAIGLGITAEVLAPGSGELVMRGVGGIGDVFKAKFSRDLEREADYFGIKYMYLAGYDPEVAVGIHERFAIEIPASMTRDFFSTHPSSPERSVRLKKAIAELKAGIQKTPEEIKAGLPAGASAGSPAVNSFK